MIGRSYRTGSRTTPHHVELPARDRGSGARFGIKNRGLYEVAGRRWLWLASVRRRLVQRRSPLGCKPRAVVALRGAKAAGGGPLPWYSKRAEGRFLRILSV